ncbi:hypothetical protein OQA88_8950 [Cercophora sp. LCS_1]
MAEATSAPQRLPEERLDRMKKSINDICKISGVAGASIRVVFQGEALFTHGYGFSDIEKQSPTSPDTIYGIGSITKSIIAASLSLLVEEGKLNWDTRVCDLLPDFRHDDPVITQLLTITDILSHRSGLAGGGGMSLSFQGDGEMLLAENKLYHVVNHLPILFPIRQGWDYFVWGYALAGEIIQKVSGKSLESFVRERLLQHLDMNDTSFKLGRFDPQRLAEPYAALQDGTPHHLQHRQQFEDTFFEASGGLFSSTADVMKWAMATLDAIDGSGAKVLSGMPNMISSHAAILNPSLRERSYGLGWVRTQLPGVVGVVGDNIGLWNMEDQPVLGQKNKPIFMLYHQGSTVGYYSHIALFPETKSAVVVLTNSIALSDAPDWISRAIIQTLFELEDGNDYVQLAAQANSKQIAEYDTLASGIALRRKPFIANQVPPIESFVGKYTNKSGLCCIEILPTASGEATTLELRFQGHALQSYQLRYLCDTTFEWSLSHDESKKRGRYNITSLDYFLFKFKVSGGKPVSFTWVFDPSLPDHPEEFVVHGAPRMSPLARVCSMMPKLRLPWR